MNKYLKITLPFLLIISACNNSSTKLEGSIYPVTKIDASDTKPYPMTSLMKGSKYVLLENTDASAFAEIDKFKFKNGKIYILDVSGLYYVYVFDVNGKFLKRIGDRGKRPTQYLRLCDFDVDANDNVYLYDRQKMRLLVFDKNNKFIKQTKLPFRAESFNLIDNNQYILSLAKDSKSSDVKDIKVVVTDTDFNVKKAYFKYAPGYLDDKASTGMFTEIGKELLYNKAVNDSLFIFDRNGRVSKTFLVDFGKYAVPQDVRNSYSDVISRRKKEQFHYFFNVPFLVGNYIFGDIIYGDRKALFIYDFKQKKAFANDLTQATFSHLNINFPIGFIGDSVAVSYFNSELMANDKDKALLTDSVKKHIQTGGVVLIMTTIAK